MFNIVLCRTSGDAVREMGIRELLAALDEGRIPYRLTESLEGGEGTDNLTVLAGTLSDYRVKVVLEGKGKIPARVPESLGCFRCRSRGGEVLVLAGADERGLMYLLLDVARRLRLHGGDALRHMEAYWESPDNQVRCMDRYLLGHLDNAWFLSEAFADYYFKRLAEARFNRFCLILGFDTAYMSPPYPFFVPVEGFEQVRLSARVATPREQNLAALRRLVERCHAYGLQFVLATWQQRPWTSQQETLVEHLPESEEGLSAYCCAGIQALLKAVPGVDIVQFRVNHESGVGTQVSAEDFWRRCIDAVWEAGKQVGKRFALDLRAKGLTERMVDHAQALGMDVAVPTKYWCEHAALPYHLSVMRSEELAQLDNYNHSRRYSYADMLRKPKKYDVIFRLWNYGSTNLFIWGDPDYTRRFSLSCGLSGAVGFQVNAPLSLKYGHELSHLNPWQVFADPELSTGEWEDERYWLWYTLFGRLGYRHDADPEIWQSAFTARFGERRGAILLDAIASASRILPLITAVHMPVHPSLRYWTEMNTGWALFPENNLNQIASYDFYQQITYGSTEPSDQGLFYGIDAFAEDSIVRKQAQGKYTPLQYAAWLDSLADSTEGYLLQLDEEENQPAEIRASCIDLKMLCHLSRYHAHKIRAAYCLACWRLAKKGGYLTQSHGEMEQALSHWQRLASLGLKAYYHDLDFSSAGSTTRRGTWADLTRELEADLASLRALLDELPDKGQEPAAALDLGAGTEALQIAARFPATAAAGQALHIEARLGGIAAPDGGLRLHYRAVNQLEGHFRSLPMTREGDCYRAVIPAEEVSAEWDLMAYISAQAVGGACTVYPGLYHPDSPFPYAVIETI